MAGRVKCSRGTALIMVGVAYLVAGLAAWALWRFLAQAGWHPLAAIGLADLAATAVVFAFSMALDNSSVYDPYWSLTPPIIGLALLAEAWPWSARQIMVLGLVALWGLRLTANWVGGWPGLHHEDWRYDEFRQRYGRLYWPVSLGGVHLFPTTIVFFGCLALLPALTAGDGLGVWDMLAGAVTGAFIILETMADLQLARQARPGAVVDRGLWAWSRHPNYLGEIGFWWGVWLCGLAADPTWWWTVVGPVAMTAMFLGVSIPWMERRHAQRRPAYADYRARTSRLILWPPK